MHQQQKEFNNYIYLYWKEYLHIIINLENIKEILLIKRSSSIILFNIFTINLNKWKHEQ